MKLAKKGNLVPVWTEIPADFDTPLSAYLKLEETGPSYLLESVEQGEKLGRYSFLGSAPRWVLESKGRQMMLREDRKIRRWTTVTDPLKELEQLEKEIAYKHIVFPLNILRMLIYERQFDHIEYNKQPKTSRDRLMEMCDTNLQEIKDLISAAEVNLNKMNLAIKDYGMLGYGDIKSFFHGRKTANKAPQVPV